MKCNKRIASLFMACVLTVGMSPYSQAKEFTHEEIKVATLNYNYDIVGKFHEGLAIVSKDSKWGFIDEKGNLVIPNIYDEAYDLIDGLAIVSKDGQVIELTAYTINGNNYFKLRDLCNAFNVGVTWDSQTNTIGIDTNISYVAG